MNDTQTGTLLVISAPSGVGKSTLIERLVTEFKNITFSISCTTRAPRPKELDGKNYHFFTEEKFLDLRDKRYFAEWAKVHGNFYGTPKEQTIELLTSGRDVLFDIDYQGAAQLQKVFPDSAYLFIFPPSQEELINRLRNRKTDTEEDIVRRLAGAKQELSNSYLFDYWIVNDDIDDAYSKLRSIYLAERQRQVHNRLLAANLLENWKDL